MIADRAPMVLPNDQDATGRNLGSEELEALAAVIASGTLTSTKGTHVTAFERRFAERLGVAHAIACNSGSAAVHAAVVAIDPEPGDEIVTTPITDMGALAPILYQCAIPVFADVDPRTLNVTARTIEAALSARTRAIVVTHLFGNPAEIDAIRMVADARGLPLIEDCAQAFLATADGRLVGTHGAIGAFSLQQGKHITCGEGGIVVTNDAALARRMRLFVNKAWPYGEPSPDHEFLALNGRMSELQGAVAGAQLAKLDGAVERRRRLARDLTDRIAEIDGIAPPQVAPRATHAYWKYALDVDPALVRGGAVALAKVLAARGIASAPRYIQKPAFACRIFREQRTFGSSRFPFTLARPAAVDYRRERYPGAFDGLERVLVLPWNDRYDTRHVAFIADSLRDACAELQA